MQVVNLLPLLPAYRQQVGKSPVGDKRHPRTLAFEYGVCADGGAMHDLAGLVLRTQQAQTLEYRAGRIFRGR